MWHQFENGPYCTVPVPWSTYEKWANLILFLKANESVSAALIRLVGAIGKRAEEARLRKCPLLMVRWARWNKISRRTKQGFFTQTWPSIDSSINTLFMIGWGLDHGNSLAIHHSARFIASFPFSYFSFLSLQDLHVHKHWMLALPFGHLVNEPEFALRTSKCAVEFWTSLAYKRVPYFCAVLYMLFSCKESMFAVFNACSSWMSTSLECGRSLSKKREAAIHPLYATDCSLSSQGSNHDHFD